MTKKDLILEKTLELIAKQGVHATPMSLIAKESGVAIGTIYHYFKSKDEILRELYLNKKNEFQEMVSKNLKDNDPLTLQFASLWQSIYDYYIKNPFIFRFLQQLDNTIFFDKNADESTRKYYSGIRDFLKKGIIEGKFNDMDPLLMAELIHGNICTLVDLQINDEIRGSVKNIEEAVLFSWRAILKY